MIQAIKYIVVIAVLATNSLHVTAQESQDKELSAFSSGDFTVYKVIESNGRFKFEEAAKKWPVSFLKTGNSYTELIIKRAGIIEEAYQADLPGYPAYYKSNVSDIVVTALNSKIFYYSWSIKTGASIKYIFSESKIKSYEEEKTDLDLYRTTIKEKQSTTRTQRVEENNAFAAKLEEENTLKGKVIKSIKVVPINKPSEIGLLTIMAIGVEFELADGKILKTKNLGGYTPYTDFEADVKGGDFSGGDFKVADDSRKIPDDKIEMTVWSTFDDKKTKGRFSCGVNYKSDLNYNFSGNAGAWGRAYTMGYTINGSNGADGKSVSISVTSMLINGEKVNKLVITETYSGRLMAEAKMHINNTLTINTSGGNGGNGSEEKTGNGGSGGNGGNGGNINVSGSGASSIKIIVSSKGGNGGTGGKAKTQAYYNGPNGSSGKNGILIK